MLFNRSASVNELNFLKVVPFTEDQVFNPYPGGSLPWQVYQDIRNALLRASREFGSAGPMGECTIDWNVDNPYLQIAEDPGFWPLGDSQPMYYLVEDQYNDEQYCYAELRGDDPFKPEWLASIVTILQDYEGWGLGIHNVPGNYLLIFGDRLMVKGPQLSRCKSALETVEIVRRLLKSGKGT